MKKGKVWVYLRILLMAKMLIMPMIMAMMTAMMIMMSTVLQPVVAVEPEATAATLVEPYELK